MSGPAEIAPDLFGGLPAAPRRNLPGLESWQGVVSHAQEQDLIARIDACDLQPFRYHGWLGKRLTCAFGWTYDFDAGRAEPGPPLPDWLMPVRTQVAERIGLPAERLEQALLIRYDPGAGIGWHKDRPQFGQVAGLSLGHAAPLRFRRRVGTGFERFTHQAQPRSLYHLSGEARRDWEHGIAAMDRPRWSITFRSLAPRVAAPPQA